MTKVLQGVMNSYLADKDARYEALADRLIPEDGQWLVPMPDANLDALISGGEFYKPSSVEFIDGPSSACHMTSAFLVSQNSELELHTGYALSNDAKWRQHSWAWNPKTKLLLETTTERVLYFGIIDPQADQIVASMQKALEIRKLKAAVLPGLPT